MKLTATPAVAERITALASAAVAIALLGLAVSAQTGRHVPADPLEQLQSQTRLQFRLGLGHDQTLLDARNADLDRVLHAFQKSHQTRGDQELLTTWLREAMARTMPGAVRPLSPTPAFGTSVADPPAPTAESSTPETSATADALDPEEPLVALQQQFDQASQSRDALPTPPALPPGSNVPPPAESASTDILPPPAASEPPVSVSGPTPTLAEPLPAEPLPTSGAGLAEWTPRPEADEDLFVTPAAPLAEPAAGTVVVADSSNVPDTAPSPRVSLDRSPENAEAPIVVNTDRLSVEIASYQSLLREVRADCGQPTLSLDGLQDAVDTLERLTTQYDFIRLYHDLLTPGEQRRLGEPTDWADALPDVRDALARVARQTDGDFLRPLESDRTDAIDELRRQIAKLSEQASR